MKKPRITLLAAICLALGANTHASDANLPVLTLAGPAAAVSFPLVRMAESGELADLAERVEFVVWRDPDQLRVLALESKPRIMAMPSNVAANLHNRGAKLKLLNVSTWGILWLVSRSPDLQTLADLKGEEIAMPLRADMPDIVFHTVAEKQGLDPRKDFNLRYVGTQSRVALARALVLEPDLLLLDGPFSALDIGLKAELYRLLAEHMAHRDMGALMITHDLMEAVRLSDTILVMAPEPGRIVQRVRLDHPARARDESFVYHNTAALLEHPTVREVFDLPAPTAPGTPIQAAAIRFDAAAPLATARRGGLQC